ncbi:FUSC family protein [Micromonospora sp. C28SCA-DRY-2]|uniref:FUSC family protein n=1 Tax=Micromonospora sp. C28SCA-DRY-2 TaxID=3059522 RepID=UPI0026758BEE|nr:FUSC family protein [Micromonospora sp. C28SCA-DRY-2]MDO3701483.1 FUSC family protein [Micromonospora sp. C28SCA-DRY-2]
MAENRRTTDSPRSPLDTVRDRGGRAVAGARQRGAQAGRLRLRQLEVTLVIALQAGLAAALAALIAQKLLGPGPHVFAPAAAVGTIAAAIGQRTRRTLELLVGVALGIVIGDVLLFWLGFGPWQTGLVVALAIAAALLVAGRSGSLVGQAGGTAVLIATLSPSERNLEMPRILDAVVGSVVGLLVVALLVPINPIRVLDRATAPIFAQVTDGLHEVATGLDQRDADRVVRALERLRGLDADVGRLNESLSGAEEVVTIAPARWHRRQEYHRYARSAEHLERMVLDSRALTRRSATLLQYGEPVPGPLPDAVARLAAAIGELRRECQRGEPPERARQLVLEAAELAGRAWADGVGSFGDTVVTDLRTAASDLLRATGCEPDEANRLVRRAAGAGEFAGRPPARRRMERRTPPARSRRARRTHRHRGRRRAGLPERGRPAR